MAWTKIIFLALIFYLCSVMQGNFLVHYNFFGAVPNLIFLLYFCLIFFGDKNNSDIFVFAVLAGTFLDLNSFSYFGASIIILCIIGAVFRKTIGLLNESKGSRPFIYFAPLFLASFALYNIFWRFYLWIFNKIEFFDIFRILFGPMMIYNFVFACILFYFFKKYNLIQKIA